MRTALLRAVSHDLRTPLASIKAMISGLRDPAVDWKPDQIARGARHDRGGDRPAEPARRQPARRQPAADRRPRRRAATDLGRSRGRVGGAPLDASPESIDIKPIPADFLVVADATLLERSLDNVVRNALRHAPNGTPVTIDAGCVNGACHIRVIDRGPGVALADRARVVQPFQRLDDTGTDGRGARSGDRPGFRQRHARHVHARRHARWWSHRDDDAAARQRGVIRRGRRRPPAPPRPGSRTDSRRHCR